MARLILEEGGKRRAFQVRDGRLQIGSGEDCTLRLTSADVAERHVVLEIQGDSFTLVPRPGVVAPRVGGKDVTDRTTLHPGSVVQIGSATLTIEGESQPAAAAARKAPGKAAPGRAAAPRKASAPAKQPQEAAAARVQRSRPRAEIKRGLPTWAMLLIGLGVGGVVFVVGGNYFKGSLDESIDPASNLYRAESYMTDGALGRAKAEIDRIDQTEDGWPSDLVARADKLRSQIETREAESRHQVDVENSGLEFYDSQLEGYQKKHLQGSFSSPEVRVFLKRCRQFHETWPDHSKGDDVRRYEARYRTMADLSAQPTFADIDFEVQSLTWSRPREYRKVFRLIETFMEDAEPTDRDKALDLMDKHKGERQAHFDDRMQQAAWHWERGEQEVTDLSRNNEQARGVKELVYLVQYIGDPDMEDQAINELVHLPTLEIHLRGYKEQQPQIFAELVKHSRIAEFCQANGLLD